MFKSGFVSIAGKPNVGKSTLLNTLLKKKVSIVSPKPQTTRKRIRGIMDGDDFQIVFQDCPGLSDVKDLLNDFMRGEVEKALEESDILLYLVDATRPEKPEYLKDILGPLKDKIPIVLLITKTDLVKMEDIEKLKKEYAKLGIFQKIIPISSVTGDGLDILLKTLKELLPEGPKFYEEDVFTDLPSRFLVAEIIREKVFIFLREEIPYSVYVSCEEFEERNGLIYIEAIIYVERESQKGILIGKGGSMIKKISTEARKDIEDLLGSKVYLSLRVKVHKKWSKKKGFFIRYKRELLS